MHFSVMLIHEYGEESIMAKRCFDADENDGAETEFQCEKTLDEMKEEYEQDADKKEYPTLESYADSYYGYEMNEDETEYGYYTNCLGMYDWYEVGGRWSNLLPAINDKKLKKLYKNTLNMKNKKGIELFRNDVDTFIKASEMPFEEACVFMGIGGCDSIVISKDIPVELILERFKAVYKTEGQDIKGDIVSHVITDSIILEENGEENSHSNSTEFFVETYNRLLERNEKEGKEFKITILDLHS
jgi:hypothetical protein